MSSFEAGSSTAAAGVDSVPLDNDLKDNKKDEVSSPLSASPTRYDKFESLPYEEDPRKIQELVNRGFKNIDICKLTGSSAGKGPLRAGPALQVSSFTIFNEISPFWESKVFGEISIIDGEGNAFYIYKCEEDDPEVVSTEYNYLFLNCCRITPIGKKVNFSLKHKSGESFFDMDLPIDDACSGKNEMKVSGKDGFYAVMKYTKIPFAIVAKVSIMMKDKNEDGVGEFDIYGTIKVNDLVLFEEPAGDPAYMQHGKSNPFVQTTNEFAVPVHSLVSLEFKLYSGGKELADAKSGLLPYRLHPHVFSRDCNDNRHYLRVYVNWVLYDDYFTRGNDIRWADNVNVKWNTPPPPWLHLEYLEPPSEENSKRALVEDLKDNKKDEVSSPLSASPTRYDKFEPLPYKEEPHKIQELRNRGFKNIDHCKLTGSSSGKAPLRAGPALQVSSVTIFNEIYPFWESKIFGEISIIDDESNAFYIYKCEEDDPEFVSTEYNYLCLNCCRITPIGKKVNFSLKHRSGVSFFDMDFPIDDACSGKNEMKFSGKNGFYAVMEYTKIPFAIIAKVSIMMKDTNEDGVGEFDIYGTIKVNDLVLFEEPACDPAYMQHGKSNPFAQLTHEFAVPVQSLVSLEFKLYSGGKEFADAKSGLLPYRLHPLVFRRDCNDNRHYLCVHVDWVLYDYYFARGNDIRWADNVKVKWNTPPPPWLHLGILEPPSEENSKRALVEVFSVFVGGESSDHLDLCGKILVRDLDQDKTVFIFARNSKIPDKLTDGQSRTVSLAWPGRWFVEKDFFMFLNLKDTKGSTVCRGHLRWIPEFDITQEHYDKRLCDVILGADGYFAAVHYSVFKDGKKARVTVTWDGDDDIVVYGSVYAAYSNHKYPSTYDEQYYRSIIFRRSVEDGGVTVKKDHAIPLSKSHVSAPWDCKGLCVYLHLSYEYNQFGAKALRRYNESLEFKVGETDVQSCRCFSVTVEWG